MTPGHLLRTMHLIAAAMLFFVGCGGGSASPAPTTHPVSGKLLSKAGRPVTEGSIEFVSIGPTPVRATADVSADGSFSLTTMTADGKNYPGAEVGDYKVTWYPVMKSESQSEVPVALRGTQKIVAGSNELNLKLP